jgi:hypothetical protein
MSFTVNEIEDKVLVTNEEFVYLLNKNLQALRKIKSP